MITARAKLLVLPLLLLLFIACDSSPLGSLSGLVIVNDTTANVTVNFTAIAFPEPASATQFVIELSNLSSHLATITLTAKNPAGATLVSQFPTGTYTITSECSLTATIPFGAATTDVTALSGSVSLTNFQVGLDSGGNPAVAIIAGTVSADLADGGFLDGTFEKDFSQ